MYLETHGLMNCSSGRYQRDCSGTCTILDTSIFANLFFVTFVCMATFVLLQLVIAVLMEQLANNDGDIASVRPLPGCTVLTKAVMWRIYRRWRYQAANKLKHERRMRIAQFIPHVDVNGTPVGGDGRPVPSPGASGASRKSGSSVFNLGAMFKRGSGLFSEEMPSAPGGRRLASPIQGESRFSRYVGDAEEIHLPKTLEKIMELKEENARLQAELAKARRSGSLVEYSVEMDAPPGSSKSNRSAWWGDPPPSRNSRGPPRYEPGSSSLFLRTRVAPVNEEALHERHVGGTAPPLVDAGRIRFFFEGLKYGGEDDEEVLAHHRPT